MNPFPPGPVLAFDSSTATGSVAVAVSEQVRAEVAFPAAGSASAALMPAVDFAMRSAGVEPRELAAIVVGGGPGSFTGVRVAAATAKGMTHALRIPLWAPASLLGVAVGCAVADKRVCALFDARRGDVYAACYAFASGGITEELPPAALPLDALLQRSGGGPPPLFAGDGALLHGERIREILGAPVAPPIFAAPRAAALIRAAALGWGGVSDAAAWEPLYLRAAGAERLAAARRAAG